MKRNVIEVFDELCRLYSKCRVRMYDPTIEDIENGKKLNDENERAEQLTTLLKKCYVNSDRNMPADVAHYYQKIEQEANARQLKARMEGLSGPTVLIWTTATRHAKPPFRVHGRGAFVYDGSP